MNIEPGIWTFHSVNNVVIRPGKSYSEREFLKRDEWKQLRDAVDKVAQDRGKFQGGFSYLVPWGCFNCTDQRQFEQGGAGRCHNSCSASIETAQS